MAICLGPDYSSYRECVKDQNQQLKDALELFSGNMRKAMKLLCKQYRIIAMTREEDAFESRSIFSDNPPRVVRRGRYFIEYNSWQNPKEVFIWEIPIHELKY